MVAITAGLSAAGGTQWARWSGADVARVQGAPSSLVGECRTPAVSVAGTIIWGSCSWLDNMEGVDTPLGFRAGLWPQPDLDRKSTRLKLQSPCNLVCRLL